MATLPPAEERMTATVDQSTEADRKGLRVRPARPADAAAVAGLVSTPGDLAQVSPDETFPLTAETVRHWIEQRRSGYVLEQRGRVVGYAELVDDARVPARVWIGHMMVLPSQRGLGLGRILVRALQDIAERERDVREVSISAFADNPRALQCYRRCGFGDRGTHRVHERELVELRYLVPGRRPSISLSAAVGSGLLTASLVLAVVGPEVWRPILAVPIASLTGLAAWALHVLLPLRRDRGWRCGARIVGYTASVAGAAIAVSAVLALAVDVDLVAAVGLAATGAAAWTLALAGHVVRRGRRRDPA